jgi:pyrroloquinoline quinone biosynthesis protein B
VADARALAARPVEPPPPFAVVLGVAQDAGYPQAGCLKACCQPAWDDPGLRRHPASLGIIDPATGERWLIDATPDLPEQLRALDALVPARRGDAPDGVLLTHAHIGHYTGLVHLGREVMGAEAVPLWVMPRMAGFLRENGPWSQLVQADNVRLVELVEDTPVQLNARLRVTPLRVPHRDEYSETVGYRVEGPGGSLLWLPDIDKWERWPRSVEAVIASVDVAFVDGTFFDGDELPGRDMAEIPHPFIRESLTRFAALAPAERSKVRFIHLNHSNPALQKQSEARVAVEAAGLAVAEQGERVAL